MIISRLVFIRKISLAVLFLCFCANLTIINDIYAAASSLSLSAAGDISLNMDPSSSGTFATSSTSTNNISVITTNGSGYTLSLAATAADDRNLIYKENNITIDFIAPLSAPVAKTDFESSSAYNNTWGLRPSKYNSANNTGDIYYPLTAEAAILDETSSANASANNYNIAVGVRATDTKAPGTYSNTLLITAIANKTPYTITYHDSSSESTDMPANLSSSTYDEIITISSVIPTRSGYAFNGWCTVDVGDDTACTGTTYATGANWTLDQTAASNSLDLYAMWEKSELHMQDIATICPTLNEGDDPITLIDSRDEQEYTVFKAKDGNCWMGENLRYGINPDGTGHPFVAADAALSNSGLDATKMADLTYDSTNPNTAGRIKNGDSGMKTYDNSANAFTSNTEGLSKPYINIYQANDAADYDGQTKYGVQYNLCAVTGGTVCSDDTLSEDAPGSVCPKGWKLPGMAGNPAWADVATDGSIKTYDTLFKVYGVTNNAADLSKITSSPLSFVHSGFSDDSLINGRTSSGYGYYWSSSVKNGPYGLYFSTSGIYQGFIPREYGCPARCVSE